MAGGVTGVATVAFAAVAARGTIEANVVSATIAGSRFVLRGAAVAAVANPPFPIRERGVGAAGVIGFEDLPKQDEEVEHPTLPQRLPDGDFPIAFTELLIVHVRMHRATVVGTRIGIQGFHEAVRGFLAATRQF